MAFSVCKTIPFTSSFFYNYNNSSRQQPASVVVVVVTRRRTTSVVKCAIERSSSSSSNTDGKKVVSNSNYVVPLDDSFSFSNSSSCITRPLAEILRDLNKKIPDTLVKPPPPPLDPSSSSASSSTFIPWYHANRMLSFYAPGWCGEIRDVIFSDNGTVTVVYRLTVRGSDGEAYRESTGTISTTDGSITDPVSAAEENAFCKACARFGLGLYLYHDDQTTSM